MDGERDEPLLPHPHPVHHCFKASEHSFLTSIRCFILSFHPWRGDLQRVGAGTLLPSRDGVITPVHTLSCAAKAHLRTKASSALNELVSFKSVMGQANSNLPPSDLLEGPVRVVGEREGSTFILIKTPPSQHLPPNCLITADEFL